MKLKSLAALVIRLIAIGAGCELLFLIFDALAERDIERAITFMLLFAAGSYGLIRYSKKWGEILCKGLDDDA